jgi:hypothetical protein
VWGRTRRGQRLLVSHDLELELAQRRRRIEAQLFGEETPVPLESRQRFALTAGAVQGLHEESARAFPERILPDQRLAGRRCLAGAAEGEEHLDATLESRGSHLRQPGHLAREGVVVGELLVGTTPGQVRRLIE